MLDTKGIKMNRKESSSFMSSCLPPGDRVWCEESHDPDLDWAPWGLTCVVSPGETHGGGGTGVGF